MDFSEATKAALQPILLQIFNGEYGALALLPRHFTQAHDEESKRQLRRIEKNSWRQAERVSQLIAELSGQAPGRPPKMPIRPLLKEMLELQIKGLKREIMIYQRALQHAAEDEMKTVLLPLQREAQALLRQLQRLPDTH